MTYDDFWKPLTAVYDLGEARAVGRWVFEVAFGLTMTDIVCGGVERLSEQEHQQLQAIQQRLLTGEPVQYVLGVADFGPRQFRVAPGVLIPRPETYELCEWIVSRERSDESGERVAAAPEGMHILDIGTGSGCIACTLAAELPYSHVSALDISPTALAIAAENARRLNVCIDFYQYDILSAEETNHSPLSSLHSPLNLIVSNPPYICRREQSAMEAGVLGFEPHEALFVPDDDPLLFYRAIARFARTRLCDEGLLYFEINPLYADDILRMLREEGFRHTELRRDQFGKERMVRGKNTN
jgi:release factor glutamine methyltransferase